MFRRFNLCTDNRLCPRRDGRKRRLRLDRLEDRRVMAAGIGAEISAELNAEGRLEISGTDGDDNIEIAYVDGRVTVTRVTVGTGPGDMARIERETIQIVDKLGNRVSSLNRADFLGVNVVCGAGDDLVTVIEGAGNQAASMTVHAGEGNDKVIAGSAADIIYGEAGDDELLGREGDDELHGGEGEDELSGGRGNDSLYGEAGRDAISGGFGDDVLSGGEGQDALRGGEGTDKIVEIGIVRGELRNGSLTARHVSSQAIVRDKLSSIEAADLSAAANGNETCALDARSFIGSVALRGTETADRLYGGLGDDEIWGFGGNDFLRGGAGDDKLQAGAGDDNVRGGADDDSLFGESGGDRLHGEDGVDRIVGGTGRDRLTSGAGSDRVIYWTDDWVKSDDEDTLSRPNGDTDEDWSAVAEASEPNAVDGDQDPDED